MLEPDAWNYEVKTETDEKEFWHEVWQKTPTALDEEYVKNETELYSGKSVRGLIGEFTMTLDTLKEMAQDVKKDDIDIDRLISEIEMELEVLEEQVGDIQ